MGSPPHFYHTSEKIRFKRKFSASGNDNVPLIFTRFAQPYFFSLSRNDFQLVSVRRYHAHIALGVPDMRKPAQIFPFFIFTFVIYNNDTERVIAVKCGKLQQSALYVAEHILSRPDYSDNGGFNK